MPASRTLTTFTVGFLLLDAVLLGYSGFALGRRMLVFWGVVFLAAAGVVVIWWRRHRRDIADLERAGQEMRAAVESLRALLQGRHLDN